MKDSDAAVLVGLLADAGRLKVVSAIVLGATSESAVIETSGLDPKLVRKALDRLIRGGLVEVSEKRHLVVAVAQFQGAARRAAAERPVPRPEALGATADQADVLRHFLVDGKLTHLPAARAKRLVVLDFLAGQFEPGRVYPEEQVTYILGRFHVDYAVLRRALVEEELLERRDGFYWRSGGTVEVD